MEMQVMESSEKNVWKYIFTDENIVLESVLYRYGSFEERTVICCSVQSGCKIGCTFCGTGKNFIGNITSDQIVQQVKDVLTDKGIEDINRTCEKFQIMFMSMGEPMDNIDAVIEAIRILNKRYPNAQLLLSTIGMNNDESFSKIVSVSKSISKVGLQFSIHKSTDDERNVLIPFKKKYSLREIRDRGTFWNQETGRKVYLNYCVDDSNARQSDIDNLKNLFSPVTFNMTFSVICEADETMIGVACQNLDIIREFEKSFMDDGYNTRIFDPAGQDDIGGGCGQLHYVQKYLKEKGIKK
jgi:23S rRNA (adenine2503-C2)-methyltransferase